MAASDASVSAAGGADASEYCAADVLVSDTSSVASVHAVAAAAAAAVAATAAGGVSEYTLMDFV